MNAMLDRLEEASARQQRFVADASHELRSPVAAIRTELEVALRTATPQEWPAVAERLLGEEARLEAVITDLLLVAHLDEGAPAPDPVPVDLADEAREEARRRAPDRAEVTIEVEAPEPAVVMGSRVQLRRALANLLDNAGRHARTTVRVTVHSRGGRVRVLVDDDGPGIPEADRERIFERFVRLDDHRARAGTGGSGLGLSLVRRIAAHHGGTARAETAPLGGARLVLDLPAAPAPR
jgi:signal transduction histidine kinase